MGRASMPRSLALSASLQRSSFPVPPDCRESSTTMTASAAQPSVHGVAYDLLSRDGYERFPVVMARIQEQAERPFRHAGVRHVEPQVDRLGSEPREHPTQLLLVFGRCGSYPNRRVNRILHQIAFRMFAGSKDAGANVVIGRENTCCYRPSEER